MGKYSTGETLADDSALCAQCGVDRKNPTPEQKARLVPRCWYCIEQYALTRGASPAPRWNRCRLCLANQALADVTCEQCGVWMHWTALIAHGPKERPFSEYPAGWRVRCVAALDNSQWERAEAINYLVQLLWQQDAAHVIGEDGPLDKYLKRLKTVFSEEPALLPEARKRYLQEQQDTRGWRTRALRGFAERHPEVELTPQERARQREEVRARIAADERAKQPLSVELTDAELVAATPAERVALARSGRMERFGEILGRMWGEPPPKKREREPGED